MVNARVAIKNAAEFARDIYQPDDLNGLRLEEVGMDEDNGCWLVTLSFFPRQPAAEDDSPLTSLFGETQERLYKSFRVDREDGSVQGMTIRSLRA